VRSDKTSRSASETVCEPILLDDDTAVGISLFV
jgi:hypothetical protein